MNKIEWTNYYETSSVETSSVEAASVETASMFRRESVYFAQQIAPRVQSDYSIDHLAHSVVADVLFGAALSHAVDNGNIGIVNFTNAA